MQAGSIIDGRFRLERLAGTGGMGSVYRAFDLATGEYVALKLLHELGDDLPRQRFRREAIALRQIQHEHVVGYVADGDAENGSPYIAMEWLEGCDLSEEIQRRRLTPRATARLGLDMTSALSAVHAQGQLHRDLKPGNVFLPDGDIARAKLIDFGLVRLGTTNTTLTRMGAVVGTPGFMAPEQARGDQLLDERVDLYALGAVLFACLTGVAPFTGDHLMAVLAKVLFDPAPRVSDLRPDVPPALDDLIDHMLGKERSSRPASSQEVANALRAVLDHDGASYEHSREMVVPSLSRLEQRFISVLVCRRPSQDPHASPQQSLQQALLQDSASIQYLLDGTAVGVFATGDQAASRDTALRAVHCATNLLARHPDVQLAIATGRGVTQGASPMGDAIDRAIALLFDDESTYEVAEMPMPTSGQVLLDEATAGLIARRFHVWPAPEHKAFVLQNERTERKVSHTLLGRETTCVGRERELRLLSDVYDSCVEQPSPRLVVVNAASGMGKSRLIEEWLGLLEKSDIRPLVLTSSGDPIGSGSPLGMLAQLVRQSVGFQRSMRVDDPHALLIELAERHMSAAEARRVAAFLGEIMSADLTDDEAPMLRDARLDARVMHDRMFQAWEDWLDILADDRPVVLVLDDLQWGDAPTVRFVDAAMRNLDDRAIMTVALGRPDGRNRVSELWSNRALTEISLPGLSESACRQLARQVLGDQLDDDALSRINELAGGNPFYLEEFLRHARSDRIEELPDSVLALVDVRLQQLDGEQRRTLRLASVFGSVFWLDGLARLLGQPVDQVSLVIDTLRAHELLKRSRRPRLAGQVEYAFRNALVRETAYATLVADDAILAHAQAARWLLTAGENDALTLAQHFRRGQLNEQAASWYQRAARQALEADDLSAVIELANLGRECGAKGELLARLYVLQAEAHNWTGAHDAAYGCAKKPMSSSIPGSDIWADAVQQVMWACTRLGHRTKAERLADALLYYIASQASEPYLLAMAYSAASLAILNSLEQARRLNRALAEQTGHRSVSALVLGGVAHARMMYHAYRGEPGSAARLAKRAIEHWRAAGNVRKRLIDEVNLGTSLLELGQYPAAADAMAGAIRQGGKIGLDYLEQGAGSQLTMALWRSGRMPEAAERYHLLEGEHPDVRSLAVARMYRAWIAVLEEQHAEALDWLRDVELDAAQGLGQEYAVLQAIRARALLGLPEPRAAEALEAASAAMELLVQLGTVESGDALIRLTHAEALRASGKDDAAVTAIAEARANLQLRADQIEDPDWRRGFMEDVVENRRILQLADAWGATDTVDRVADARS